MALTTDWKIDDFLTFLESVHAPRAMYIGQNCVLVALTNDTRELLQKHEPTWLHTFPTNHHGADKRIAALKKSIALEPVFISLSLAVNQRLARDFMTYADFSVWKSKFKDRSDTVRAGNAVGSLQENILDIDSVLASSSKDAERSVRERSPTHQHELVTDLIRELNQTFQNRFDKNELTQNDIKAICAQTQKQQNAQSLLIASNQEAIETLGIDFKLSDSIASGTTEELRKLIADLQSKLEVVAAQASVQAGTTSPQQKFGKFLERSSDYLMALRKVHDKGEAIFVFKNDRFLSKANGIVTVNLPFFQKTLYIQTTRVFKLFGPGFDKRIERSKNSSNRFIITAPNHAQFNGNQFMSDIIENRSNSNTDFSVRWSTPAAYNSVRALLYSWKHKSIIFDFDYSRSGQFMIFLDFEENDPKSSRYSSNKNSRHGKSVFAVKDPLALAYLKEPSADILRKVGLFNTHFLHEGELFEVGPRTPNQTSQN